jgi:hypothetical protein
MPTIAQHVPIYDEILAIPGVVSDPVLLWGVTKIKIPDFFRSRCALIQSALNQSGDGAERYSSAMRRARSASSMK